MIELLAASVYLSPVVELFACLAAETTFDWLYIFRDWLSRDIAL